MSVQIMYEIINRYTTESHIQVARAPASYPACPWFESLPTGSLSLRIRGFLDFSKCQNLPQNTQLLLSTFVCIHRLGLSGFISFNATYSRAVVTKECSADPEVSANCSQGIRGILLQWLLLKFTYFLKEQSFVKNNPETSLIGDMFISYGH